MRNTRTAILFCALTLGLACGGDAQIVPDADDDTPDAPVAAADARPTDAMQAPMGPSRIVQTSGGGTAVSAGYRLSLRVGAPQPAGSASSAGANVRLGPFAGR